MVIDSINTTVFFSNHYWWKNWENWNRKTKYFDTWFVTPDEVSTGGVGFAFRIPILRVGFYFGVMWMWIRS